MSASRSIPAGADRVCGRCGSEVLVIELLGSLYWACRDGLCSWRVPLSPSEIAALDAYAARWDAEAAAARRRANWKNN